MQGPTDDFDSVEEAQTALRRSIDEATRLAQDAEFLVQRARQETGSSPNAAGAVETA